MSNQQRFSGEWETKQLYQIADCLDNVRIPLNEAQRSGMPGPYPYCGANGVLDYVNDFVIDDDVILMAEDGGHFDEYSYRPIAYRMKGKIWVNNHAHVLKAKIDYDQGFLYYSLVHKDILPYLSGGTRAKLNRFEMNKIEVNLPQEIDEQRAIAEALSDVDGLLNALEALIAKKQAIKQATMQQLLTGKTRLPGFSGAWEKTEISNLLSYRRPDAYIVKSTEYLENGDVPVLTANKAFILGYTDEVSGICHNFPVIVFDDFTTDSKYATFPFKVKSSAIKLLYPKHERVSLKYVFERMQLIDFPLGNHKRYYISEYQNLKLYAPDYEEQQAIASVLSDMDAEITALEQRRDKTRAIKQGMMQQLLTGRVRLVKPSEEPKEN